MTATHGILSVGSAFDHHIMSGSHSFSPVHMRARAVGFQPIWTDASGHTQIVRDEDLENLLSAYSPTVHVGPNDRHCDSASIPALLTGDAGAPILLPKAFRHFDTVVVALEAGDSRVVPTPHGALPPGLPPGYHSIIGPSLVLPLAIAPTARSHDLAAIASSWGPAIQIPSLRGDKDEPFGTFDMLMDAARLFARAGADLVALSPTVAVSMGSADPLSPYSPSSRQFSNTLLLGGVSAGPDKSPELIDWDRARTSAHDVLRDSYQSASSDMLAAFRAWRAIQPDAMIDHATFAALACFLKEPDWRRWPAAFRDRASAETAEFKDRHERAIDIQLYAQWRAADGLGRVQSMARSEGMAIGLIADLPIGVAPGGSDVWRDPQAYLEQLTIGAPPDPLGPDGQLWGVTTFRPDRLRSDGFKAWIALLRSAFATAGAVRIDHGFGLERLWVVAGDNPSASGAYLSYPRDDLFRLLALEAYRAGAHVILEDLGTKPPSFADHMDRYGFLGMRVLWFEQDDLGSFGSLSDLPRHSIAMTSTHDTATLAGWWQGRDLDWRVQNQPEVQAQSAKIQLVEDRASLWETVGGTSLQPEAAQTDRFVDLAIEAIATSSSCLKIVPLEDLIGLVEQPNLPGTTTEHPNWRRRLPAPLKRLLDQPCVARRIVMLHRATRHSR